MLLLFLDGVGLGEEDEARNPFVATVLPTHLMLTGGIPITRTTPDRQLALSTPPPARVLALDATLGFDGLPQSGTGQAALLTGRDAVSLYGGHFGPWTPVRLRPVVENESLLRRAVDQGFSVAFANAYPRGWPGPRGSRAIAAPPLAARGAGLLHRHEESLARGDAVASEMVNDGWRRHLGFNHLPRPTAEGAGRTLARIAARHQLTLFAHYTTDTAGHRKSMSVATGALRRVDDFLQGLMAGSPEELTVVIASDHGNIEDVTAGHTRNPALGMVWGPGRDVLAPALKDLTDVAPAILEYLAGIG